MNTDSYYTRRDLLIARFITAIFSLLLSIVLYTINDVLNADGILYIYSVEALKDGGLAAFSDVYDWPFFSSLISGISTFAGIDVELAAKSLCSLLFVLLTDALVLLSSLSLSKRLQLMISVVLILSFYTINHYRDFIIRDIGYWALSLYGLYFLCKFLEAQKVIYAFLWQFLTFVAFLFRIEAIVFLVAIPAIIFITEKSGNKITTLIKLSFASVFILFASAVVIFSIGHHEAFQKFSEVVISLNFENTLQVFNQNAKIISEQVMHPASDDFGPLVLASGLIFAVLWDFSTGISIPLLVLLIWAFFSKSKWVAPKCQYLVIALISINLLILGVFALKSQLITTRYIVFALILLLILVLPTLIAFIEGRLRKPRTAPKIILGLIIILSLADTLITTGAKPFLRKVPEWAADELPSQAKVMTNDFIIEYYFNKSREGEKIILNRNFKNLNKFDFLLVHSKAGDQELQKILNDSPIHLVKEDGNQKNKVSLYAVE